MFINRKNPDSIHLKSNRRAFESISDDLNNMPNGNEKHNSGSFKNQKLLLNYFKINNFKI